MRALRILAIATLAVLGGTPLAAQVRDWPAERPPAPLIARETKFPPFQTRTLKNGLQVIAVSHHEQPAVTLHLIVRAGGSQDPIEKPGVAAFMAGLLDQGTTTKSAEQIANTIDSIGGVIGSGSTSDLSSITAAVMKDSFGVALDLVSDIARNPAFSTEEIERQRKQILSGLQVSYEDPEYLAGVVFDRLVYGFHPYGKPDSGTPGSIAAITRDDLVKFHKAWFSANNAILAIVGDVTADEAFAGAERAFSSWTRAEQPDIKPVDPPPATRRVVIVDRPGAVQTEIRAGNIGLPRKHPDYIALNLALRILGGEGGNRLHRVLRSERGLTYGASAELHALKDTGNIVAETDTRSETTAETLRLLVDELARLQRNRVSDGELREAQRYITGSFPLTVETPGAIARQIINAVLFGLDLQELQTFRERVNSVTVDDIQRVSQKYLQPDRLSIVLVGDASVFAKQLTSMGFDQVERISLAELDLTSPDLRRKRAAIGGSGDRGIGGSGDRGIGGSGDREIGGSGDREIGGSGDREIGGSGDREIGGSGVRGFERSGLLRIAGSRPSERPHPRTPELPKVRETAAALIARAIQAKGGAERLKAIRTVTATVEHSVGRLLTVKVPSTISISYPDRFRMDTMAGTGRIVQVFNRGEYWVQDRTGARQVPAEEATEIEDRVQRDTLLLLTRLGSGQLTATRVDDLVEDGRALPAVRVAGAGTPPVTLVLDPATALIVKQRYTGGAKQQELEEVFSDYRDVDGVKVAFKAVFRGAGVPTIERTVRSIRYNVPIDPALFVRPS